MGDSNTQGGGLEALHRLKSIDPPLFLSPNSDLSLCSRAACEYLYACLKPYTPKSPFDELLTNGFDAEQIWQQIDLQSQPLISSLRREIKRFEKDPDKIFRGIGKIQDNGTFDNEIRKDTDVGLGEESEELDEEEDDLEVSDDEKPEQENEGESESEDEDGEEEEEDEEEDDGNKGTVVDDKFLKIKELEKYLKEDEEREYGSGTKKKEAARKKDADEEDDDDEEEDDDKLGLFRADDGDDKLEGARYEDFFVSQKKSSKESKRVETITEEEHIDNKSEQNLSKHERAQKKLRAKIDEMEKANLQEKTWTMQGEVTAAKRPKDSALEADLDFELNIRPPPVITEEVTASIEEIIKKRINEGQFDDVERKAKLPPKAPREFKELDENKSKKGLAELYEEEYVQKTGLGSAPLSFSDESKKEATSLFKALCLKLDALTHFQFAPKPVIEDMSVETNLPAIAMEEVAPVAVSDAALLAPEEVFSGKGDVKEEAELTQSDRKRRRAKKKRKFKAEQAKRSVKRPKETTSIDQAEGKDQPRP